MVQARRPVDLASMSVPELIQKSLVDFTREDLYIGIPVIVTSTKDYETKQTVDVRPLINDEYRDEVIINAPTLKSIFVKIPNGGNFSIKLPIAVGDLATLHYMHRNISTFLDGFGAAVDTPIDMIADIKDCYVTHGFGTRNAHQSPSKTDFIIEGPNTKITITPDGTITATTTGEYKITASKLVIDADVEILKNLLVIGNSSVTGTFDVTSTSVFTGQVTINGIVVDTHTHISASPGSPSGPMQ